MIRFLKLIFMLVFMLGVFAACGNVPDIEQVGEVDEAIEDETADFVGWAADIEQFREHVVRWHPRFANRAIHEREENLAIRQAFDVALDDLLLELDNLEDQDIYIALQRAVALLRDNHFFFTGFAGYDAPIRLLRYPLQFGWFADGFYLYRADPDFDTALNRRLVAINGIATDDLLPEFARFWSVENAYDARYQFAALLNAQGVLQAIGIHPDGAGNIVFSFEDGPTISVGYDRAANWERMPTTLRWLPPASLVEARMEGDLPLYFQNFRQNLWHTFVEEYGILYVCIRGWVLDTGGAFSRAVRESFDENEVRAVIIDARGNPGGDANQFAALFRHLAQNLDEGRLFYFVNEGSNSGSLGAAYFLEDLGAVIVGQPLAQNSDFFWFGSTAPRLFLSYSRMEIFPPPAFWSSQQVHGRTPEDGIFRPHVLIAYTIDDWVSNRDPFWDFVVAVS